MKLKTVLLTLFVILCACSAPKHRANALIEIIDPKGIVNSGDLKNLLSNMHKVDDLIFRWQNHWVIYTDHQILRTFSERIVRKYPNAIVVKRYEKPFYIFNRETFSGEKSAPEWEHIIMSANLINDTLLQNEYMALHRSQTKKWPEVSKGFCKAEFQQLLIFRNGRQLMLVISIPKGKSFDELNPKTYENNPRVKTWNKLMTKYQEGIEGAPKGTTWITFRKVP